MGLKVVQNAICGVALLALTACGPLSDARTTAEGVDDAVTLLQDLDQRATWDVVGDAAAALGETDVGYTARLRLEPRPAGDDAATAGGPGVDLVLEKQANGHSRVVISYAAPDGATLHESYFVDGSAEGDGPWDVYRLQAGRYRCANADAPFLRGGTVALLEHFAADSVGPALLAVIEERDEATHLGRAARRHTVQSRVPLALDTLQELGDEALASRLRAGNQGQASGEVLVDDETGGLLAYEVEYSAPAAPPVTLSFVVTAWADGSDIARPDASAVEVSCE